MRAGIVVNVTRADRHRLEAIVLDRSAPQKHVWRANIILATAEGCGTAEIMPRSGKSKPVVWRWQARFMSEGVEGLTRDKTRKPGKRPLPSGTVQRVVDLTLEPPPGDATHWTGRMLAKVAGVSLRSVQRILEAHQLAPHRIHTFKLSTDPKFAEKLTLPRLLNDDSFGPKMRSDPARSHDGFYVCPLANLSAWILGGASRPQGFYWHAAMTGYFLLGSRIRAVRSRQRLRHFPPVALLRLHNARRASDIERQALPRHLVESL
jgi:Homeodomain-like domain